MVIGRIALKKAKKLWKYNKDTKETLKRGKAKVIQGGKKGKRVKKYRKKKPTDSEEASVRVTGQGKIKRVHRLSDVDAEVKNVVNKLKGEIGPPPPKVKNNPKLNLQIRTKLKELEAADKRKKKKPKNGKKK